MVAVGLNDVSYIQITDQDSVVFLKQALPSFAALWNWWPAAAASAKRRRTSYLRAHNLCLHCTWKQCTAARASSSWRHAEPRGSGGKWASGSLLKKISPARSLRRRRHQQFSPLTCRRRVRGHRESADAHSLLQLQAHLPAAARAVWRRQDPHGLPSF